MILLVQVPSATINLAGVVVTENGATFDIGGTALINGQEFPLSGTFDLVDGKVVFLTADGTLSEVNGGAFAHVAWVENGELHVIKHT